MTVRYHRLFLLVAVLFAIPLLVRPTAAHAQDARIDWAGCSHIILPQARAWNTAGGAAIEITGVFADVRIHEQTATTTIEIGLRNPGRTRAEAVLVLPTPDGAAVSGFAFDGLSAEATAHILPRDVARRIYDDIVAKIRDPALLEFAGYNLLRTSVFPIEPGGFQKVRLTYEHLLPAHDGRIDYALPRTEALGVRTPWSIRVRLTSARPINTAYSPSHPLVFERISDHELHAQVDKASPTAPGPFLLSYLRGGQDVAASLFAYPDDDGGASGGYFLLMAGAPISVANDPNRLDREVTIVIDRSGSMAGEKMDQVRAAALQIIEGLDDGERFNIIDYSTRVAMFADAPVEKRRETILEARTYLASIRPNGGTNIHEALQRALGQPASPKCIPMVLFLTDGLPTVGETSEVRIRDLVATANPHRRRVFTFGVGSDVNAPLLDRIAELTRAVAINVLEGENVEMKVARMFRKLYGPVLSDIRLSVLDENGRESTRLVRDLIPEQPGDLFEGDQLILLGQYLDGRPKTFRLAGDYLGQERTFDFRFAFDAASRENLFVPRLWATRRIADLVDEIRQAGAESAGALQTVGGGGLPAHYQELVDEIMRLSTKFGVLTEYTAFLAAEGQDLGRWNDMVAACSNNLWRGAVQTRSGRQAVSQSMNQKALASQRVRNFDNRLYDAEYNVVEFGSVQQIADLTFYRTGEQWVDARLIASRRADAAPDEVVTFGTPRHRAIVDRLVRERRQGAVSLRQDTLLLLDGRIVLILAPGDGC